jgi:hypothetical protein
MLDRRLGYALFALRLAIGVQAVVLGLTKFNTQDALLRISGVVELLAGILIFTPYTETAGYFLTGWLLLFGLKALGGEGAYGSAVAYTVLAACAFALAHLTRLNEAAADTGPTRGRTLRTRGRQQTDTAGRAVSLAEA